MLSGGRTFDQEKMPGTLVVVKNHPEDQGAWGTMTEAL